MNLQFQKSNQKINCSFFEFDLPSFEKENKDETDGKIVCQERFYGVCSRKFYVGKDTVEEDV